MRVNCINNKVIERNWAVVKSAQGTKHVKNTVLRGVTPMDGAHNPGTGLKCTAKHIEAVL